MSTAPDLPRLFTEVEHYGGQLVVEAGDLVLYHGARLPAALKAELRSHKGEIIQRHAANDAGLADALEHASSGLPVEPAELYEALADFFDAANTVSLPMHAHNELDEQMQRWVRIHTQSNPLPLNPRPRCVVKCVAK
jgi:hypothetical protein